MSVVREQRDERLQLGGIAGTVEVDLAAGRSTIRRKPGVVVISRGLYPGAVVSARVDFPGPGVLPRGAQFSDPEVDAPPLVYRFEQGLVGNATLPGGGVVRRTVKRILIPPTIAQGGPPLFIQPVPAYAAFAPVVDGTLVRSGRREHQFTMPGLAAALGDNQWFLRVRWVGTPVAAAALVTGAAAQTLFEGLIWGDPATPHHKIAPGTVVVNLPSGGVLRDDGLGRLVSDDDAGGDGVIDYVTGAYQFRTQQAETGNVLTDYEHDTNYQPLDVHLEWDARASQ